MVLRPERRLLERSHVPLGRCPQLRHLTLGLDSKLKGRLELSLRRPVGGGRLTLSVGSPISSCFSLSLGSDECLQRLTMLPLSGQARLGGSLPLLLCCCQFTARRVTAFGRRPTVLFRGR